MGDATKAEIRRAFLAQRRALTPPQVTLWSATIQQRVRALPELAGHEDVYIYIAADNEPETRGLINAFLEDGRRVFAPIVDGTQMHWGEVCALNTLVAGAHGLYEPPAVSRRVDESHKGVAIVPCVAFTAQCDRLGRGGGYYDKFLATFSGPSIALAYELQRAEAFAIESHDVRPHRILTESQQYSA